MSAHPFNTPHYPFASESEALRWYVNPYRRMGFVHLSRIVADRHRGRMESAAFVAARDAKGAALK